MRKNELRSKGIGLIIAAVILLSTLLIPVQTAGAASKYIKVNAFIKQLVTALKLEVKNSSANPYIDAALGAGILKESDFINYSSYINRTDAAVLLNRADEYLHGDTINEDLLSIVLKKRISDISKIAAPKREAVARIYAKGIIIGYGNGYYIQNRAFKGSNYLTKTGADNVINLTINPEKRSRISPDGMLIRTTDLPKNADKYDYILACYPNAFYEKEFEFTRYDDWKTDSRFWAYPVEMKNETFKNWYDEWSLSQEMDKYLYNWAALAEKYLNYVFNVDYRTVDDEWVDGLASIFAKNGNDMSEIINTYYIKPMKANHVVVESSIIAVEPSTFYDDGGYCMRAYVKYRITADDISVKQSKLIYASYPSLKNLKSGKWRTGIFDIRFSTNNGSSGDGSDFAIGVLTRFVDE
jgi:hypothetical protein